MSEMNGNTGLRLKTGLAEMLKGGVIMDVTNASQAEIAEKAGATAVNGSRDHPSYGQMPHWTLCRSTDLARVGR